MVDFDKETGEILDSDEQVRRARADRYILQSVSKKALPEERVGICLRKRIINKQADRVEDIKVWRHRQTQKAFYSGLMICGSVWVCPVCAAKISERRRRELRQAFDMHKQEGGYIALLTLTFRHQFDDSLKEILGLFSQATKKFMSGRAFQNIRDEIGMIGRVRALEVTYGKNGFHPHTHIALFYTNAVDLADLESRMYVLWEKACSKVGLTSEKEYGLSLDNGDKAKDYISKWGTDHEMTKAHIKKSKDKDGLTPFDFLRKYVETEDVYYLYLFRDYVECFKGKRQLQWSQGLKQRFTLEEKTDEQLAKEQNEEADILGLVEYETWKLILKYDKRSYFLDLCEKEGFEEAVNTINEYKKKTSSSQELDPNII